MLLSHDQEPSVSPPEMADPDGLMREARRRARVRRMRRLLVGVLVVGLAVVALLVGSGGGGVVVAESASRPFVNVGAFAHQGELAFVSRGAVWVLNGSRGTVRRLPVPTGETASSPSFSRDGRWLVYLVSRGPAIYASSLGLWLAHGNGTGAHPVGGLSVDQMVGWSPAADQLAVIAQSPVRLSDGWTSLPRRLELVSASGSARELSSASAAGESIEAAIWSPDGRAIAVSTYSPYAGQGTIVRSVRLADPRHATVWFSIRNPQRLPGICTGCVPDDVIAHLAGWWPRWGIVFWIYSSGATHNNDETPLALLETPGARPQVIAQTLSDGVTDAVAAGAGGQLAVVASTGQGRFIAAGKVVERCQPSSRACTPIPGASVWSGKVTFPCRCGLEAPARGDDGSGVSLDPSWSARGRLLAYVKAPVLTEPRQLGPSWYQAHALDLWNADTGTTLDLRDAVGAQLPTWSRNGRELLYVADDGLWLLPLATGRPVEIERPLYAHWNAATSTDEVGYFGQIPWSKQFSWSPR